MKTRMIAITLSALGAAATGCLDDGLKKACDANGQCLNGYSCVQQVCVPNDSVDGIASGPGPTLPDLSNAGNEVFHPDLAMVGHDLAVQFDMLMVKVDLATGCTRMGATGGGVCFIQTTAACAVSYALSCNGTTCTCSADASPVSSFAQTQSCDNNAITWLGDDWTAKCGFAWP
jgi:hypothetical protein